MGSRARWRQQAGRERRLEQVTGGVARAAREAEQPRRARHALPCRSVASRRLGASNAGPVDVGASAAPLEVTDRSWERPNRAKLISELV
eukprot:scaffold43016_cov70-Phaeocystis_antarctica.AAC.2